MSHEDHITVAKKTWKEEMATMNRNLSDEEIHGVAFGVIDEDCHIRNNKTRATEDLYERLLPLKSEMEKEFNSEPISNEEAIKILRD